MSATMRKTTMIVFSKQQQQQRRRRRQQTRKRSSGFGLVSFLLLLGMLLLVVAAAVGTLKQEEPVTASTTAEDKKLDPQKMLPLPSGSNRSDICSWKFMNLYHDGCSDSMEFSDGIPSLWKGQAAEVILQSASSSPSWIWFTSLFSSVFSSATVDTNNADQNATTLTNSGATTIVATIGSFWKGFTSAVALIVATEIGDKTFFMAAVMSMKHDRLSVFSGAISALAAMTILSTLMGLVLPQLLDRKYTHILGAVLFLYFAAKMYWESRSMKSDAVSDELEEVEEELLTAATPIPSCSPKRACFSSLSSNTESMLDTPNTVFSDSDANNTDYENTDLEDQNRQQGQQTAVTATAYQRRQRSTKSQSGESSLSQQQKQKHPNRKWTKKRRKNKNDCKVPASLAIVIQSFTLTFLAEWGDRSQFATVALAAHENAYGVILGGCLGHSFCTGLAVLGGRMLAARISEKVVAQWGAIIFAMFGIHSLCFSE